MNLIIFAINAVIMTVCIATGMEDIVPIHFGINGVADNYGSKWTYMLFAIVPLAVSLFYFIYSKKIDFKNKEHNRRTEKRIITGISYFFAVLGWGFILFIIGEKETLNDRTIAVSMSAVFSLFLIFVSNYYGKIKQNYYLGVRIPWTLNDEKNWSKTHRFAGYLGVITGIILLIWTIAEYIFEIIPPYISIAVVVGMIIFTAAVIPSIYSYILYRKSK